MANLSRFMPTVKEYVEAKTLHEDRIFWHVLGMTFSWFLRLLLCFIALIFFLAYPFFVSLGLLVLFLSIRGLNFLIKRNGIRHFRKLLSERSEASICTFARAFDRRSVDPWILRSVYDLLKDGPAHIEREFPILPEDNLFNDLLVDEEDMADIIGPIIAFQTGRSLEGYLENFIEGDSHSVRDLVMFFNAQPLKNPASA